MPQHLPSRSAMAARALGLPQRAADADDEPLPSDAALLSDEAAVVRHPDGYYWLAEDGEREFGPFETREAALADRASGEGEDGDDLSVNALLEVEDELGMSTWIDPDTGAPAEQTLTRLEDH